jgi:hypothetical protein
MTERVGDASDRALAADRMSRQHDPLSPKPDSVVALARVGKFSHRELAGETLHSGNLSPSEASELLALASKRRDPGLEPEDERRYEQLVGRAAGDERLFERKRRQAELRGALAEYRRDESRLPQAESILAAVFGDPELYDLLRPRPRENVGGWDEFGRPTPARKGEFATARILEPDDIGVLFVLLGLIVESGGEIAIADVGATARLPDRGLPHVCNLGERLSHLRGNGYLDLRVESGTAFVSCGPRVRKLCKSWELTLPPT